jgi:RHS repeat-associated protein
VNDASTINNQPSTHFVAYDGNGNVGVLVNAAGGTVSAQYDYGPFGELLRATGPMAKANPFRFSTKYQDDESDLLYYGYRYYRPSTGRWIIRDPSEEDGGLNLYGFVAEGPLSMIDSLGLSSSGCCSCLTVDVTYSPGGAGLLLGPYTVPFAGGKWHYYGNLVHVKWYVDGDPKVCRYFQDEKGSVLKSQRINPPGKLSTTVGVDGNEESQEYDDDMGQPFGWFGTGLNGTWTIDVQWNVTFRCESYRMGVHTGGVSAHDQTHVTATYKVPWVGW